MQIVSTQGAVYSKIYIYSKYLQFYCSLFCQASTRETTPSVSLLSILFYFTLGLRSPSWFSILVLHLGELVLYLRPSSWKIVASRYLNNYVCRSAAYFLLLYFSSLFLQAHQLIPKFQAWFCYLQALSPLPQSLLYDFLYARHKK